MIKRNLEFVVWNLYYFLVPGLLLLCTHSYAQTQIIKDPIDQQYDACIAKDSSEANIGKCAFDAYARWEKEMDKCVKKLSSYLISRKEQENGVFMDSQHGWLNFRDKEFKLYNTIFNKPGAKWALERANNRLSLLRQRTLQVRVYYETLLKEKNVLKNHPRKKVKKKS